MRTLVLGAALTACLAGSAMAGPAQPQAWLTLKTKTSANNVITDGAVWRCKVNVCRAARVKAETGDQACRQLAARLGELTAFSYRGQDFAPAAVAACNTESRAG